MARSEEVFDRGLDAFDEVVRRLRPEDWEAPSPCEGWTALDVLGHLGSSIGMGISVLQGRQPEWPDVERPADLVEGEPTAYWQGLVTAAREALEGTDPELEMDTPMGRRTVRDRLAFPAVDLYVHAWDIGRAAGLDVEVPAEAIELAHGYIDPLPTELVRGPQGAFDAEVEVPPDATPTEAFIAWTGRDPRWRPR